MCTAAPAADRSDALVERLFEATIGTLELFSIYLGTELGLYRTVEEHGPLTSDGLAERAGIAPRYAREWCEQQAVAALLEVEDAAASAHERRYALSPDHARVLAHADDAAHVAPFAHLIAGIGGVLPAVADAFRTGAGVPYERYGRDFRHGQGHINRPAFTDELPARWIPALTDVHERLQGSEAVRVADVGCGQGWASMAVARAFPGARVDGFDLDEGSIADARRFAAEAGVERRTRFIAADAATIADHGPYDVVLILETLHDLSSPVEALAAARRALAPGGCVLVVDERVADTFTAPGDEVERMMFGWSVVHCLPTQMVDDDSAAIGTAMRADTVRELAAGAGYSSTTVLDVENDLFRLYRLDA